MSCIMIAAKPKYPTRKLVDKVLFNEDNFIEIANIEAPIQVNSLLNTSFVAIIFNDKYYPITIDNYAEQFELAISGSVPTVEENPNFGIKSLYCFMSVPEPNDVKSIQNNIEIYTGICSGSLYRVNDFNNIGIESIDKNGFWFAFNFDIEKAESIGYSDIKYRTNNGFEPTEVSSGTNYIYMGKNANEAQGINFSIQANFTFKEENISETIEIVKPITYKLILEDLDPKANIPSITMDGKPVNSVAEAFALAEAMGLRKVEIEISKSIIDESDPINLSNGMEFDIRLTNNATLTLKNDITILNGKVRVYGNGVIQEKEPYRSPIMLKNTDENNIASLYVSEGVTLSGYLGIFVGQNARNCHIETYGHLISSKLGEDTGSGLYVNGTAKSGSAIVGGEIESEGLGLYLAGNFDTTINNAIITGVDSAVEIRAGSLDIYNSKLTAISEKEPNLIPNSNGSTAVAVALAVSQHTTNLPINVTVHSGTFKGNAAFMQGNPQENKNPSKVSVSLLDGAFLGSIKTLKPEADCVKFITGGRYTEKPDQMYISDKYHAEQTSSGSFIIERDTLDDTFIK